MAATALSVAPSRAAQPAIASSAWDAALSRLATPVPIVQSWGWGAAEAALGHRVIRVALPSGAMATVVPHGVAPFAHCTAFGGPVPATAETVRELAAWARAGGFSKLLISPEGRLDSSELAACGFRHRPGDDSGRTLVVALAPQAEMFATFKTRARTAIRRAEKAGVTVTAGAEAAVMAQLAAMTAARQRIYVPGEDLYRALLDNLTYCRTYVARLDGEPLAAAVIGHHDGRAYYLFGGSSNAHRELAGSHAVQWAAMKDAFLAGCRDYDMWGVPPNDDPAHPMHGLLQFKTGFGGRIELRPGVWEIVLSPWREAVGRSEQSLRIAARNFRDRLRGRRR